MNRNRLLPIVRAYLVTHGAPLATEYSAHYLLRWDKDTICPNCNMTVSAACEVSMLPEETSSVWCVCCKSCETLTCWPKR